MTKEDFINIIDSNDKELIKKYINDPQFIAFIKQTKQEFQQKRQEQTNRAQKRIADIKNAITDLIESNKNTQSNPKVLSLNNKLDDSDLYEDTLESFCDQPESTTGNVLVCTYNTNKLTLEVNGIYQNVTASNFGNEIVFISDNKTINGFGDGDNTGGDKKLEVMLTYLDVDIMNPDLKIDPNLFNTGADYFVLISNY